jgi:hypothetical protein
MDEIDSLFSDLDTYYPGSKRKRREEKPKTKRKPKDESDWTTTAVFRKLPSGELHEFYQVGALAQALGRPLVTIRYWIKEGYIPQAPYRLSDKETKNGETQRGRRLYSRSQIEKAVELFGKAGLLDKTRIQWPNQQLTNALAEAWESIKAAELNR